MKRFALVPLTLAAALSAWAGDVPAAPAASKPADSMQSELVVGETLAIKLPCNPTTGYEWQLKSVSRKIATPVGEVEFQKSEAKGLLGSGGTCVLTLKGVKPGKTKVVLVYRRSWEKGEPAKTFIAYLSVVAKGK